MLVDQNWSIFEYVGSNTYSFKLDSYFKYNITIQLSVFQTFAVVHPIIISTTISPTVRMKCLTDACTLFKSYLGLCGCSCCDPFDNTDTLLQCIANHGDLNSYATFREDLPLNAIVIPRFRSKTMCESIELK